MTKSSPKFPHTEQEKINIIRGLIILRYRTATP